MRLLILVCLLGLAGAQEAGAVRLLAPLTTVLTAPWPIGDAAAVAVEITVPADAAPDLSCGIWIGERHDGWFQLPFGTLKAGERTVVRAPLDNLTPWSAQPGGPRWSAWRRAASSRWGLYLWSSRPGSQVTVRWLPPVGHLPEVRPERLINLTMPARAKTGERWELSVLPDPYPSDPFDPELFALDLEVLRPDGVSERVPAFHDQPMRLIDAGSRELGALSAPERFLARYRPRMPGHHHLTLCWRIANGAERRTPLPDLTVEGTPWDDYVRVDAGDPRFLSTPTGFVWPVGLNLQSITDRRSLTTYDVRPTVDRGTFSYDAYLARLAAAGGDAAEIWLSSWNLALEWNPDWYGYFGLGRYSEFNATRLDKVLDLAWSHGIRLVLNLNNHGQFLPNSGESEWIPNPYNQTQGGPLSGSDGVFTDRQARRYMARLRRYLAGRYADHPAVLTWKLWSEVDLTSRGIKTIRAQGPGIEELRDWHAEAAADWKRLDVYHHPVSTHFATTWQNAHPLIVGLPDLDLILIDAYYAPGVYTDAENLSGLMVESTLGLAPFGKPFFATEYGGGHNESMREKLAVEHASGAFLALVCGNAAAPMLWWHEWVDQRGQWAPYTAIRRFLNGEDLRGGDARSLQLTAASPDGSFWCRAWSRKGRLLIYLQDREWSVFYKQPPPRDAVRIRVGDQVAAGDLRVEWWDADTGMVTATQDLHHSGGQLDLQVPDFVRHCAAKLMRR
jgi:hypothetical protein